MNAIYWGLTALCVMGHKDALDRDELIEFVLSCWDESAGKHLSIRHPTRQLIGHNGAGAFGAHPDHDAHIHSTLSAIQILTILDAVDKIDVDRVVKCLYSLPFSSSPCL
jgi:geranylgeranyl transferase type-2 subunit beta